MANVYGQGVHGDDRSNGMGHRCANPFDQHLVGESDGTLRILHNNHKLLAASGPNANGRHLGDAIECLDCNLNGHRGNRIAIGVNDMNAAALDPQPTLRIDMANIARAMPHATIAGSRTGFMLSAPQLVVAIGDPRGAHHDFARSARRDRLECSVCIESERGDQHRNSGHRLAHAHTVACASSIDCGEINVGHGQAFGHAVRGVQLGVGTQRSRGTQRCNGHRGAGRKHQAQL